MAKGYGDTESQMTPEEQRKKRIKWTIGIIAFVVFQVAQALFFILVIMKFKSPKFRVAPLEIQNLTLGTQALPSFDINAVAPIRIKNTNWGPFKYGASTVDFTYGGMQVGQAIIPKGKVNFKSTKKFDVNISLSSANLPNTSNLGSDLSSEVITLNSQGQLNGKVTVMFMFKKKKTSQMNCTMAINITSKIVQSLACK